MTWIEGNSSRSAAASGGRKVEFFGLSFQPESGPIFDSGVVLDATIMGDILVVHHAGSTQLAPRRSD